jgi:hypothetical protein
MLIVIQDPKKKEAVGLMVYSEDQNIHVDTEMIFQTMNSIIFTNYKFQLDKSRLTHVQNQYKKDIFLIWMFEQYLLKITKKILDFNDMQSSLLDLINDCHILTLNDFVKSYKESLLR